MLTEKSLVLCHGHKHRKIQELDYSKTVLATIHDEDEPDVIVDLTEELPKSLTEWKFSRVIDAFGPCNLKYHKSTIKENTDDTIVDAVIDSSYLAKVRKLLAKHGLFYTKNLFEDKKLLQYKMFAFGFEFIKLDILTFDETPIEFNVYKRRKMPKFDELIKFIDDKMQAVNIREVQVKYTEELEDDEDEPRITFFSIRPAEFDDKKQLLLDLEQDIFYLAFLYDLCTVELINSHMPKQY